jgi:hypothetical protein
MRYRRIATLTCFPVARRCSLRACNGLLQLNVHEPCLLVRLAGSSFVIDTLARLGVQSEFSTDGSPASTHKVCVCNVCRRGKTPCTEID